MSKHVAKEITDAIAQSNVMNVGSAPTMSSAPLYQSMAHSTGLLFEQSVRQQRLDGEVGLATTAKSVAKMYQGGQQRRAQREWNMAQWAFNS